MSMENATFTDVAVGRVAGEAFQPSTIITNLRIIGCRVREMERNAVASVVQRIHVERSEFGSVSTSAVTVSNELVLYNNRFKRVAGRGFVLNNLHSVRVDGNTFGWLEPEAFYESSPANRQDRSVLRVRDNEFAVNNGSWSPTVRLQKLATETDVAGNRFVGSPSSCGCGPWLFVAVAADDSNGTPANGDYRFLDRNYCKTNALSAVCANLTTAAATATHQEFPIGVFTKAAGCGGPTAAVYERCVKERAAGGGGFRLFGGTFTPDAERGIITTVVLLVLCGFGAVCAVSAITWLNARGYFIKLRSLLTANGTGGDGNGRGGMMARTMSAHSLSPMSVHEYAELQRNKLGGSGGNVPTGSDVGAVRVIVFQDKGTQTVPEELTHEMLQSLRDKLDDPEDYAEARGMIEHLYDLIRVEETCCRGGGGGGGGWYSVGGLDDMTSTITTKAVTVGQQGRGEPGHDVKSVGTGVPSLDRLWPPRINVQAAANREVRYEPVAQQQAEQRPPPPRPSVGEYMDPADLYGTGRKRDDEDNGDDADIYCELADLRGDAAEYRRPRSQPPTPPPVPDKPTEV
ncbi:Hypothetical protein CINCED_3A003687 [Cinara cedri]|nr:Hypothetical protein CINCED_3A003687 [Cinara cedri]